MAQIFHTYFYDQKPTDKWDTELRFGVEEDVDNNTVEYIAAAPPDYRQTFTGSGLPFANIYQAYHATPNKGRVVLDNKHAVLRLQNPSAYLDQKWMRTDPHVLVRFTSDGVLRIVDVKIGPGVHSRDILYNVKRTGPEFYDRESIVQNQETLLRACAYPA